MTNTCKANFRQQHSFIECELTLWRGDSTCVEIDVPGPPNILSIQWQCSPDVWVDPGSGKHKEGAWCCRSPPSARRIEKRNGLIRLIKGWVSKLPLWWKATRVNANSFGEGLSVPTSTEWISGQVFLLALPCLPCHRTWNQCLNLAKVLPLQSTLQVCLCSGSWRQCLRPALSQASGALPRPHLIPGLLSPVLDPPLTQPPGPAVGTARDGDGER